MKDNILKVINTSLTKEFLKEYEINLTVNYNIVYGDDYNNPILLGDVDIKEINDILNNISDIGSYNLTLIKKTGKSMNLRHNVFTFWSGVDEDEKNISLIQKSLKYGKFEWSVYGDMDVFGHDGVRSKLKKHVFDDDFYESIDGNYFEYDKLSTLLDMLHEFYILLVEQNDVRLKFYERLRLEI